MSHKVNVREQMGWAGYALLLPVTTISKHTIKKKHTIFLFDRMITLLA